jgi:hypothetical protein
MRPSPRFPLVAAVACYHVPSHILFAYDNPETRHDAIDELVRVFMLARDGPCEVHSARFGILRDLAVRLNVPQIIDHNFGLYTLRIEWQTQQPMSPAETMQSLVI